MPSLLAQRVDERLANAPDSGRLAGAAGERDFGVRASIGEGNRGPNSAQGDEQDDGGDQCARTQTSPAGCQQADGSIVHDGILPAIQPEQMSVAVDRR